MFTITAFATYFINTLKYSKFAVSRNLHYYFKINYGDSQGFFFYRQIICDKMELGLEGCYERAIFNYWISYCDCFSYCIINCCEKMAEIFGEC